jgi:hypothetical protein
MIRGYGDRRMIVVHVVIGVAALALNAVAAMWGGWCWWRSRSSAWFWRVLRAAQVVVVLEVALGGLLILLDKKAVSLHYIYGVLPLLVSLLAEQLRISSAQTVLDSRGFENAQAVGRLAKDEQRAVVVAIVRMEVGVMALSAFVNVVLLARAAMVVH